MSDTKWCIKCTKELGGDSTDLSIFGISSSSGGVYCKNSKCERYGLLTVIYLQEDKKAPKDVKTNDPIKEQ